VGRQPVDRFTRRDWFLSALLVLALAHAIWGLSVGWTGPLASDATDFFHIHEFRQSQNSIAIYWMLHGGHWLDWEIPVFGPPWSMPLEFPIYQWLVAVLVKVSGLPIEQAGRWVNAAFFFASLGLLYLLLKELGAALSRRLIVLTLVMVSPLYIFWSRTVMVESAALFFGMAYLYAAARFFNAGSSSGWLMAVATAGALAGLSKVTTYAAFAFALGLYVAWHLFATLRRHGPPRALVAEIGRATVILGVPLVAIWIWNAHADAVKMQNPLTAFQTSDNIRLWLTGTLATKIAALTPSGPFMRRMADHILGGPWPLAAMALALIVLGPRRISPWAYIALACFFVVILVFTNVHAVHNYYQYANAMFLLIFFGIVADQLLQRSRFSQAVGAALIGITVISCLWTYHRSVLPTQYYAFRSSAMLSALMQTGKAVEEVTDGGDVLVAYGLDWNPFLPFYSARRALMTGNPDIPDPNPDWPGFKAALSRISQDGRVVGAAAFCGAARETRFKPKILTALALIDYPAYSNLACDVFVHHWPATGEPRRLVDQSNGFYVYAYEGKSFAAPVASLDGEYRWYRPPAAGDGSVQIASIADVAALASSEPMLLGAHGEVNIVRYGAQYYGLPQRLGPVDFRRSDPVKLPGVVIARSKEAVIVLIESAAVEGEEPVLLHSVGRTNIVRFRGRYYGVPQSLGEVRWRDVDVGALPGVTVGNTPDEIIDRH
jgi:hypothetical protein